MSIQSDHATHNQGFSQNFIPYDGDRYFTKKDFIFIGRCQFIMLYSQL